MPSNGNGNGNGDGNGNHRHLLSCPVCGEYGGRMFQDSEYRGQRLFYFWECLNCARQFDLSGRTMSYRVGKYRVRISEPVLAGMR